MASSIPAEMEHLWNIRGFLGAGYCYCAQAMQGQRPMTGEQKLENVAAQIAACEEGRTNLLTCPFCQVAIFQGDDLCCKPMAVAVSVILDRKEQDDRFRHLDAVAEKVSRN